MTIIDYIDFGLPIMFFIDPENVLTDVTAALLVLND